MDRGVLLCRIRCRSSRSIPTLPGRPQRGAIIGFDLAAIIEDLIADLGHRGSGGMDVAVGAMPEARFIVHEVVFEPPA